MFLLILTLAGAVVLPQSQATTRIWQGFVKDETGAVLPGATVLLRQVETSLTRELITDGGGYYRGLSLPSGTYEVSASLAGFTTLRKTNIQLSLGQSLDVDITLKVSGVAEQVTVEATTQTLEMTKTEVSTTVNERAIQELPKRTNVGAMSFSSCSLTRSPKRSTTVRTL